MRANTTRNPNAERINFEKNYGKWEFLKLAQSPTVPKAYAPRAQQVNPKTGDASYFGTTALTMPKQATSTRVFENTDGASVGQKVASLQEEDKPQESLIEIMIPVSHFTDLASFSPLPHPRSLWQRN